MTYYSNNISLIKNSRGVYDLDPSKGCFSGMNNNNKGCYGECYAFKQARQYGYDFKKTVFRDFENIEHLNLIRKKIFPNDVEFIRFGVSGDPSENWCHTLKIINLIYGIKPIVVITKHWNNLSNNQLNEIKKYNLCINTSISALDSPKQLNNRLEQYNKLKKYCKSVLRVVSCDFNTNNLKGLSLNETQKTLFNNKNVIDNVLRVSLKNDLVLMGVINIQKLKFLTSETYFSKKYKSSYIGSCYNCPDKCGLLTT